MLLFLVIYLTDKSIISKYDDVIKWKHFPRYWPFVRGIHRWPMSSSHKCQWRGPLMFSLIYAWIDGWVNNGEAGDLRRYCAHYDVIVVFIDFKVYVTVCCDVSQWRQSYPTIIIVIFPTLPLDTGTTIANDFIHSIKIYNKDCLHL